MSQLNRGKITWLALGIAIIGVFALVLLARGKDEPVDTDPIPLTEVNSSDHILGSSQARVTLIEYADFQCPSCAAYFTLIKELERQYPDDLRVVFRQYPLIRIHPNALRAAMAAEAGGAQGKFFEMHDLIFAGQKDWSDMRDPNPLFIQYAQTLGLNATQFENDLLNRDFREKIDSDLAEGTSLGVTGTPTFFLNGVKIDNPRSLEDFKALIEKAKTEETATTTSTGEYHAHSDFLMVLDGKKVDLSKPEFQSTKDNPLHEYVHLHNDVGTVIHQHQAGITLGDFLKSLGFKIESIGATPGRFALADTSGKKYTEGGTVGFEMAVNGKEDTNRSSSFFNYKMKDLDRIYLRFGENTDESTLLNEAKAVSNDACIYSETCPERGTPPEEECVGGLGTTCE